SVDPPRLSAELLLSRVLKLPRIKLYTDYDRVLTDKELSAYRELVRRAGEQEPIAYLTGQAHFFNLEFDVTRDRLIPRPDTETLDRSVREYEPIAALDGGIDGLMFHRRILKQAPPRMVSGGRIFLEIAFDQGPQAEQLAREHDAFDDARILKDFGGRDRVLTA